MSRACFLSIRPGYLIFKKCDDPPPECDCGQDQQPSASTTTPYPGGETSHDKYHDVTSDVMMSLVMSWCHSWCHDITHDVTSDVIMSWCHGYVMMSLVITRCHQWCHEWCLDVTRGKRKILTIIFFSHHQTGGLRPSLAPSSSSTTQPKYSASEEQWHFLLK